MQTGPHSHPSFIAYTPGTAVGGVRSVNQTADVNNSSNTTPSDVTGLSFALVSGTRYFFKFVVQGRSAATTTGLGFCFSAPAMTFSHFKIKNQQGNAGTDQYYESSSDDDLTAVLVNASVIANNTDYIFIIEGICQPSANGTLQLRCRSEIDTSQITVKNGIGFLVDPDLEAPTSAPHGITDNHIVTVDDASAADNEYAKFTDDGIEGRTYEEVRLDIGARERLTGARTYYVRADGSDSNTGLVDSAGGAFLTPQHAYDVITGTLDLGGNAVTVQCRDGAHGALYITQPWTGGGSVSYLGNITTPANVSISYVYNTASLPGILDIRGFTLPEGVTHFGFGIIMLSVITFVESVWPCFYVGGAGAYVWIDGNTIAISGDQANYLVVDTGGVFFQYGAITLSGTPDFSGAFVDSSTMSFAWFHSVSITGGATGKRYSVTGNSLISTEGGGANFLPGDVAGTDADGGRYI